MWTYYGSKSMLVKWYPKPHDKVIEPFAGVCGYLGITMLKVLLILHKNVGYFVNNKFIQRFNK